MPLTVTERQKKLINENMQMSADILRLVLQGYNNEAMEKIQDQRNILEALELEVR